MDDVFLVPDHNALATLFCVSLSSAAVASAFPTAFCTSLFDTTDATELPANSLTWSFDANTFIISLSVLLLTAVATCL